MTDKHDKLLDAAVILWFAGWSAAGVYGILFYLGTTS